MGLTCFAAPRSNTAILQVLTDACREGGLVFMSSKHSFRLSPPKAGLGAQKQNRRISCFRDHVSRVWSNTIMKQYRGLPVTLSPSRARTDPRGGQDNCLLHERSQTRSQPPSSSNSGYFLCEGRVNTIISQCGSHKEMSTGVPRQRQRGAYEQSLR